MPPDGGPAVTPAQLIAVMQAVAAAIGINLATVPTVDRILTLAGAVALAGLLLGHDLLLRRSHVAAETERSIAATAPDAAAVNVDQIASVIEDYLAELVHEATAAKTRIPIVTPETIAGKVAESAEQAAAAEAANGPPATPGAPLAPEEPTGS